MWSLYTTLILNINNMKRVFFSVAGLLLSASLLAQVGFVSAGSSVKVSFTLGSKGIQSPNVVKIGKLQVVDTSKNTKPIDPKTSVVDFNIGSENVYPNPTTGVVNVRVGSPYRVVNNIGVEVVGESESTSVDLSCLPSGEYILIFSEKKYNNVAVIKK